MSSDLAVGLVACAVSSVFFGSQFVPIKSYDTGDVDPLDKGFFIQWLMGCGVTVVGFAVNAFQGFPPFYPLAMLGGFLWATGNVTSVPIVNEIGMALGILLWSSTNLIFGWASGRFGWFGIKAQLPASDLLNALGLVLSIISTVMFGFVKSQPQELSIKDRIHQDEHPLIPNEENGENGSEYHSSPKMKLKESIQRKRRYMFVSIGRLDSIDYLPFSVLRIIAVSLVAGAFYGLCFVPVIYIQDNYPGASKNGLDYVFSHYFGVFVTSTTYLCLYSGIKRNNPFVNNRTVLGGLLAGVLWAVGQTAWFVANDKLSQAISFPIVTRFPGVVAAAWGVFFFREIRGRRNLQVLLAAIFVTCVGGVLSGLSKEISL